MKMRGVLLARVDERIGPLDDELRAGETQHLLRCDIAGKSRNGSEEGSPLHRD
jgi:ABC-type cobalamin transport system ATPase subunit